jgi:hypothetical protein
MTVITGLSGVEKWTNKIETKKRYDILSLMEDKEMAKELRQVKHTLKHQIKIKSNLICLFCLF